MGLLEFYGIMVRRWEDDWMHSVPELEPKYVALSRLYVNDQFKALVQFHRNTQRQFYTVSHFNDGIWGRMEKKFPNLEEAKAAALSGLAMPAAR